MQGIQRNVGKLAILDRWRTAGAQGLFAVPGHDLGRAILAASASAIAANRAFISAK